MSANNTGYLLISCCWQIRCKTGHVECKTSSFHHWKNHLIGLAINTVHVNWGKAVDRVLSAGLKIQLQRKYGWRKVWDQVSKWAFHLAENDDLICIYDGGKPVGDEHRRPLFHHLLHGSQDVLQEHKFNSVTEVPPWALEQRRLWWWWQGSELHPSEARAACLLFSSLLIRERQVQFGFLPFCFSNHQFLM